MNEEYGILYQYYRNTELPLVIKLILDGSIMLVDLLLTLHVILLVLISLRVFTRPCASRYDGSSTLSLDGYPVFIALHRGSSLLDVR